MGSNCKVWVSQLLPRSRQGVGSVLAVVVSQTECEHGCLSSGGTKPRCPHQQLTATAKSGSSEPKGKSLLYFCVGLRALHIFSGVMAAPSCLSTRGSVGQIPSQPSREELGLAVPVLYVHLHSLKEIRNGRNRVTIPAFPKERELSHAIEGQPVKSLRAQVL